METSKQQTLPFGAAESMSSPAVSPANRSVLPGNGGALKMTATCGPKCCEQFARLRPGGLWARTFSELLIGRTDWYSSKCVLTWRLKATRFSRLYFQLQASVPRTSDTEPGLLPTVQTQGLKVCKNGKTWPIDAKLLPTPSARDFHPSVSPSGLVRKNGKLRNDALCNLPVLLGEHCQQRLGKTSQLNPLFVAEMMSFPCDWTESPFRSGGRNPSRPTETPSSRNSSAESSTR